MSCTDCTLSNACNRGFIQGIGSKPRKTKYMFIQEAPSRDDDRSGIAMTSDTDMQRKFSYLLEQAGLDKRQVHFTYALKCKPKNTSDIKKKHMEECRKYLFTEIVEHKPDVIIPMGRWAFQAVSDKTSIREFRGHFTFEDFEIEYPADIANGKTIERKFSCKILPTWSLIGSLAKWEYHPDMISDFKKAKKYVEEKVIDMVDPCKLNVILTEQGLRDFVEKYREIKLATTDFETTGFHFWKDKIINAGYYNKTGIADILYVTPYEKEHLDFKKWSKQDVDRAKQINSFLKAHRSKVLKSLQTVNGFKHLKLALHNGKFDAKFAAKYKIPYRNFWFDTLVADSLIDENLGHALNIAMERRNINFGAYDTLLWPYTNKDENKKKSYQFVPPPLLEKYLGIDVQGDYLLLLEQFAELEAEGMKEHFFKRKMPALRDLLKMEFVGVKGDRELFNKSSRIIQKAQSKLMDRLVEITDKEDFNPNSPKQIVEYMMSQDYPFARLKVKETKSGFSTSAEELGKFLVFKKWKEFPQLLLNVKKLTKIRGTYIDGKDGKGGMLQYLDSNDRIHANYNIWTARTSRYSCNKPSLQVWPRPIKGLPNTRQAIVPTNKDWCLFEADYSQLEQCVVAVLSGDPKLLERIQSGMDLHCVNASDLGRVLQTVPKWVEYEHMMVSNDKADDLKIERGYTDKQIESFMKEVEKHGEGINWKEKRTQAKNIGFGLNYGKTAVTFAEDFRIDIDDAEEMVDAYFKIYSVMKAWRDSQVEKALTQGYVNLLSERKRRFHHGVDWLNSEHAEGLWSTRKLREEIGRQAMNSPVQGGAHDVFESACIRLLKRFRKEGLKARLLLSIHDGIVGECPIEERPLVNKCILEEMPQTFNAGTPQELTLKIDTDFYKWEWYGEKIKL